MLFRLFQRGRLLTKLDGVEGCDVASQRLQHKDGDLVPYITGTRGKESASADDDLDLELWIQFTPRQPETGRTFVSQGTGE